MRATQIPIFTIKEDPKDAQVASHRLLTRAGFIRKQAGGLYTYLPFGYQIHRKIEQIIREEMDRFGGVEIKLPVITPAELWKESGRWDIMGRELMRLIDRHEVAYALAPTHEESVTELARTFLQSYKQLPINLYQIGTKYRDEIRPRYGLIRCREFVMKDAYSFHVDEISLEETYSKMRECYRSIFQRCELKTLPVQADSGTMGGAGSEEFMVPSEIGEETLLLCPNEEGCGYRSNQEKASLLPGTPYPTSESSGSPLEFETPGKKAVEDVMEIVGLPATCFIKAIISENETDIVVAFIPGDRELSETKLKAITGIPVLEMAEPATIYAITGAEPGYAGPHRLKAINGEKVRSEGKEKKLIIIFDQYLKGRKNLIAGANKTNFHIRNLEEGRDFFAEKIFDISVAVEGDTCPACKSQKLITTRGIEVGHIFKLGTKYGASMKLQVLDKHGKPLTPTMGCYGIGVGRTLATIVEQNHDERGIIWPPSVSPYQFHIVYLGKNQDELEKAVGLYKMLCQAGKTVYFDDRDERPGIKFNDADLIGFPYQLVLGKSFFQNGKVELKIRKSGEKREVIPENLLTL